MTLLKSRNGNSALPSLKSCHLASPLSGSGARVLEPLLEVGRRFLWQKRLHDDSGRDGIGEGLEEAEP